MWRSAYSSEESDREFEELGVTTDKLTVRTAIVIEQLPVP